jgi:hypothetical protein
MPREGSDERPEKVEYYKRAAEAHRLDKRTVDTAEKADLFDVERG